MIGESFQLTQGKKSCVHITYTMYMVSVLKKIAGDMMGEICLYLTKISSSIKIHFSSKKNCC